MSTFRGWWWSAGVAAGALGVTTSYLAAGILRVREAPVVAVGEGAVALTPGPVVDWAIATFGESDKLALGVGMAVVLGLLFGWFGQLAQERWWAAVTGFCVLAAVGAVAVAAKPGTQLVDFAPIAVGLVVWLLALAVAAERLRHWEVADVGDEESEQATHSRRRFLGAVGLVGVAAVATAVLGKVAAGGRRAAEESRNLLRLNSVTKPPSPVGVGVGVEGVTPWRTNAEDFYLIDTALIKPTIEAADWRLRIHGMVEQEIELDFDDLVSDDREITQDWITLNCVSNEVGGDLIGNAWWSGYRLASLLAEAGPLEGADAVLQTSEDGWTCGTPLAALMDERNAMLAVAMNGEPLEIEHGFPVRTIVPGLYGYVSACKWVVDMEVTRFEDITAYWSDKGWSEMGPVKMSSRIDVPSGSDELTEGSILCAGMAWAQHTGISGVEVSLDGGAWQPADLAEVPNVDTWVQWRATVDAPAGDHRLRVRAIDADGTVQTGAVTGVRPDGATGWHTVDFTVGA
ncbi:molybdopterin-dependent oxidoreductase [Nocardioides panacisoli]|uniref:molybdopterin-dependent oxidoreductase n=1 Tax=Nocardioides panacisoli TaxID=627624 RepID=UPI001C636B6E|nr:molybdopterin-dependent oxidoreductase [Nocardioides panacisoli]QYJ02694.1 molybdopterin-dependent oxidoreductase [Nocardioides panacisoli]